ncbi:hypothetical protein R6Q59_002993 [Mikania micrantha]
MVLVFDNKKEVDFQDDNYEEMDDQDDNDVEEQFDEGGDDDDDAGGNGEQHEEYEVFSGGPHRYVVEEDLSELCEPFGHVVEKRLVRNRDTNKSKDFAFLAFRIGVVMVEGEEAQCQPVSTDPSRDRSASATCRTAEQGDDHAP